MLNERKDNLKNIIPDFDAHRSRQDDDDREHRTTHGNALNESDAQLQNNSSYHNGSAIQNSQAKMEKNKLVSQEEVDKQNIHEPQHKEISPSPTVQDIVPNEMDNKESNKSLTNQQQSTSKTKVKKDSSDFGSGKKSKNDSDNGKKESSDFDDDKKEINMSDKKDKDDSSKFHSSSKKDLFGDDEINEKDKNPIDENE